MEKEQKNETLLELFNTGLEKWTALENDLRPAETLVRSTIETFERCSELVEKNSLFSSNETLDDITSASLTYLTIPYYLSELYQKIPISAPAERRPILALSRRLLEQYLGTCVNYEILSKSDIAIYEREVDPDPGTLRNEKIARIRQTKAIDEQIKKNLQEKIAKGLLDDDQECELDRENQILFVRNCALKSIDALRVLKEEEKIMDHMLALMTEHGGKLPERPKDEPREPLKPIILEDPRKKITDGAFLPGWNLPTVSIEEAGMIDHKIALEQQKKSQAREAKEKLVKEYGDSDDDETELQKKREWDDWKDDNKKGSGNTGTKGYFY